METDEVIDVFEIPNCKGKEALLKYLAEQKYKCRGYAVLYEKPEGGHTEASKIYWEKAKVYADLFDRIK